MKAEEELSQEECHQGIYMEDIKITFWDGSKGNIKEKDDF